MACRTRSLTTIDTPPVQKLAFPTSPDPDWDPDTLARWQAAREVADGLTGSVDRFGWATTTESIPGTGRYLAATVTALAGVVPVTHLLSDVIGRVPASYTAVALATAVMVAGARHTLRADTANHPPARPAGTRAPEPVVVRCAPCAMTSGLHTDPRQALDLAQAHDRHSHAGHPTSCIQPASSIHAATTGVPA